MTTHPPGGPTGPTGPGRTDTPGSPDAAFRPSDGPGANPLAGLPVPELLNEADLIAAGGHDGIGEPHEHSTPPLPRLGEVVRDAERLLAQAAAVLKREVDPASEPTVPAWPALDEGILVHRLLLDEVAAQLNFALHKLDKVASLPVPPVGSAVKVPSDAEVDVLRLAELIKAAKHDGQ